MTAVRGRAGTFTRVALLVGLAGLLAAAGCSGDSTDAGSTPSSSTSPSSAATPVASPTVPAGWTGAQQGSLAFALPPGFTKRPEGSGMPGAAAQWTNTSDAKLAIPPAVAVFVETGAVGPLEVRTDLVGKARSAELGAQPVGPAATVDVPGSTGAKSLEWVWDYAPVQGQPAVPSRQVEVVVQTAGDEQYGLLIGGPASYLTDEIVDSFLSSIAVVTPGAGA